MSFIDKNDIAKIRDPHKHHVCIILSKGNHFLLMHETIEFCMAKNSKYFFQHSVNTRA